MSDSLKGKSIAILGAGVVGMTTALELTTHGASVTVYAQYDQQNEEQQTTSNKACALFLPIWIDPAQDVVCLDGDPSRWAEVSWDIFKKYLGDDDWGIRTVTNIERVKSEHEAREIDEFFRARSRVLDPAELQLVAPDDEHLVVFETLVIETPRYLPRLYKECRDRGCEFVKKTFFALRDVEDLKETDIVSCLGLGSRRVFNDEWFEPARGQLALFDWNEIGLAEHERRWLSDHAIGDDTLCVIPRKDALVIGSLYERVDDRQDGFPEDRTFPELHKSLFERLRDWRGIVPNQQEAFAKLIDHKVAPRYLAGVRPCRRKGVRIEKQEIGRKTIVHNYGHGGGGVTLSWGTAVSARELLQGA